MFHYPRGFPIVMTPLGHRKLNGHEFADWPRQRLTMLAVAMMLIGLAGFRFFRFSSEIPVSLNGRSIHDHRV